MKNIEIKTTQNVVLEYELAGLRDRAIGYFIDLAIIIVGILLLSAVGFQLMAFGGTVGSLYSIFLVCIFLFYAPAMEILNHGQSVGKMAMRIQVIKTTGGQATFSDYAARWVFRAIDIYFSIGGIASVMVASSARGQRIGDIVANTAVIKLESRMEMNLDDLLAIHNQNSYKPSYPQVKQLQEEDVLLIKSVLDRQSQFDNEAHDDAMQLLVERLKFVLEIQPAETENRRFLQVVLKDYIVLTR